MKLKMVVVDLELTRNQKRVSAALACVALAAGTSMAFAEVPVTFTAGDVLTAASLNQNFQDLDGRLTTVEAAQRPPSAFKAERTTSLSVPSTTVVFLDFDDELFDLGDEYDPATGVFTAANAGIYLIQCASETQVPATGGQIYASFIVKNGVELFGVDVQATPQTFVSSVATAVETLDAGDEVECAYFQTSGQSVALFTDRRAHFSVVRVD